MQKPKRVVIVAGEESGDQHAAELIKQLKATYPTIQIAGIGGRHMEAAGAELIANLARYGVTGLTAVARHFKVIRQAFYDIKRYLNQHKPDLLILVDYPGFNLRLAKYAKRTLGLKIVYYISPQIWAWKAKRIHLIKECVDNMAVILPFEKKIYMDAGVPVRFVGHPLTAKIPSAIDPTAYRQALKLPLDTKLFALLPGSRLNEINALMPVLQETATLLHQQYPNSHFVIPVADTMKSATITSYFTNSKLPVTLIPGKAIDCMAAADFVIVASGTASLECALLQKPMCIVYRGSRLSYYLAMKLVKVRYLGLCNLLTNALIAPEFLQDDCNAIEITRYITRFFANPRQPEKMITEFTKLKESLSQEKSDCSLFDLIDSELTKINA